MAPDFTKPIPAEAKGATVLIPAGEIKDEPRFSYRGMHLDVGRHFFPKEFIKKYIDLLALHNMNTFHWHLTEDQGWRIEIKKYPKLTEIGSQRSRTVIGRNTQEYDNTPYGGFYTQEEAKEIAEVCAGTLHHDNSGSRLAGTYACRISCLSGNGMYRRSI